VHRLLLVGILLVVGCKTASGPARCYGDLDCGEGEVCVRLDSTAQTCVGTCDHAAMSTCTGGEACVALDVASAPVDVCLPGGVTAVGGACDVSSECVLGAICLTRPSRTSAVCERLCTVSEPNVCGDAETCMVVDAATSATRGTCTAP